MKSFDRTIAAWLIRHRSYLFNVLQAMALLRVLCVRCRCNRCSESTDNLLHQYTSYGVAASLFGIGKASSHFKEGQLHANMYIEPRLGARLLYLSKVPEV